MTGGALRSTRTTKLRGNSRSVPSRLIAGSIRASAWIRDGTPLSIATGVNVVHNHSFSQELRLSGALGTQVDWTVGAYYFDERSI